MNILVTGGLGLIGHNVVKRLQDQGHNVSIIDNKTNYGIIPQEEIDYLLYHRLKKIDEYKENPETKKGVFYFNLKKNSYHII